MKIKFLIAPKGRDYKVGQVVEFQDKNSVEISYARKYVARGWAEEVTASQPAAAQNEKQPGDKDGAKK